MDARSGVRLRSCMITFIPAIIKKNKNGFYIFIAGNGKVLFHAHFKSGRILLPGEVMEKNTHAIETDRLGITQFTGNHNPGASLCSHTIDSHVPDSKPDVAFELITKTKSKN